MVGGFDLFIAGLKFVELEVAEIFDVDHLITGLVDSPDEFVQLQVDGASIAVLSVLDEEDHEEGDDSGSCVDDELPGIGEVKHGASDGPDNDDQSGAGKGPL